MKRISILVLVFFTCLVSAEWLHGQLPNTPRNINRIIPHFPRKPALPQIPDLLRRVGSAIPPETATRDVVWIPCPPDAYPGALCGNVPVPLDRNDLSQGTININFELYTHTAQDRAAKSAVLFNLGGPGAPTAGNRGAAFWFVGQNLDVHDLLLIDDRGRGLSGTIDCEDLQNGTGSSWDQEVAECAAQLGSADSRYGTGDIAQDTEAVRAALGYDKVDYYGISEGGADVTAYATRFESHLRSIVGVAPYGTPGLDDLFLDDRIRTTRAEPRLVRLDCQYSPTCSADHPFPEAELDGLIWTVRLSPVEGYAHDANGNPQHVVVDENALLDNVIDINSGRYSSTGEILAAADSLWRGDSAPLLRLGAEGFHTIWLDMPVGYPASAFSDGAMVATYCVDETQPWDWSKPVSERSQEFAAAVAALPTWYFAPFSKEVATGLLYDDYRMCLDWEKPTPSSPVTPPHPTYPSVPTLFLVGDMDNSVPSEEVKMMAALFPNSTVVTVAGIAHPWFDAWPQCAINLGSRFLETLQVGDTTCAKTPETVWPAVGRFPLVAADARPAEVDPSGQNQIGLAERKVVTVAVATATDALQRSWINYWNGDGSGNGAGLRAGTFFTDFSDFNLWATTLTNCAFSEDVTVNGTITWVLNGPLVADLTVSGSGTAGGTLHVEGTWQAPGPVDNFNVTGTLGGKHVAVLVPEA